MPKLNCNESTTIKRIRELIKKKNTCTIRPFKQSLEERKLQFTNRSLIPFKCTHTPFLPNTPHKAMKDHAPNRHSAVFVELAQPASYKLHNTIWL